LDVVLERWLFHLRDGGERQWRAGSDLFQLEGHDDLCFRPEEDIITEKMMRESA
jgi:hypothetical protein